MLNFVIALPAEARPIIRQFGLVADSLYTDFRIYRGDQLNLILSGIGSTASAAAVGYLAATQHHLGLADAPHAAHPEAAWLNLGVAGHGTREVGTALVAHKVTDSGTGRSHYPAFPFSALVPTCELITVGQPETEFAQPCAYDMEASGFYGAALRFSSVELVHCLKVVSDTKVVADPAAASILDEKLRPEQAELLLEENLESIEPFAQAMQRLALEQAGLGASPQHFDEAVERWRFSRSQLHLLRKQLHLLQSIEPGNSSPFAHPDALRSGKEVLAFLDRRLADAPLRIP